MTDEEKKEKRKQYQKERYHWLKSKGICVHCGQEKAQKGTVLCRMCTINSSQYSVERYHRKTPEQLEHYKEYQKEYQHMRRQKLLAEGVCTRCGKRPARAGYKSCKICSAEDCKKHKEKRLEKGIMPRFIMGKGEYCYFCGKSGCNGEKVCPECRERLTANLPHNKPSNNHIWRKETSAMCEIFKKKKEKKYEP
ncbi:MAG: hypothetical protein NC548_43590 [Lachnospiraceae bacterium]|nr:hypothetical protein [Lachnospiraceae bacterium]